VRLRPEEPLRRGKRRDRGGSRRFGWSFGRGVPEKDLRGGERYERRSHRPHSHHARPRWRARVPSVENVWSPRSGVGFRREPRMMPGRTRGRPFGRVMRARGRAVGLRYACTEHRYPGRVPKIDPGQHAEGGGGHGQDAR
jgi:hypothetical protein